MSDNCLFCKIVAGTIPASKIHEDDDVIVINDINAQAPLHALVIPRRHIATVAALAPEDDALVGAMHRAAAKVARDKGYADRGFRTVFNTNADAGQTVFHIHLHVLAGRGFTWPPG
jgi:histidine triad (HIT) family protein